jgi:hypothetical protein
VLGVTALLLCGSGCSHGGGTCGHVPVAAPTIVVTDSVTGAPICDASVMAVAAGEEAAMLVRPTPLNPDASNCEYILDAPPGAYDVTVSRDGYQSATIKGLVEQNDWCGALGPNPPSSQNVSIHLVPAK